MSSTDDKQARSSAGQKAGIAALLALGAAAAALAVRQARQRVPEGEAKAATLRLLGAVLPERRGFDVRLWDGTVLPAAPRDDGRPAPAQLVLTSEASLGRMLNLPLDMALGEAYLLGDVEIEGDVGAVAGLADDFDADIAPGQLPSLLRDVALLRRRAARGSGSQGSGGRDSGGRGSVQLQTDLSGEAHSRARDLQAISYHYDVSNDFYKLFLDGRMVYSCAYFPTGTETLDEAQAAKLELICRKLRLKPGERLLDIGCGWGGLAIYAAQHYGVQVTGVTLSREQLAEGRARVKAAGLEHLVSLELLDYRDVAGEFDKVSSVGMAEHVGRKRMDAYFQTAWQCLKPGGLMLNHAISDGLQQARVSNLIQSGNFARKYVFPDGELLPIWETLKYAEGASFEVRDVENLREHYAKTLAFWSANLDAHRAEALAELGPVRFRLWRLYMGACVYYFQKGHLSIFQVLLAKPDEQRQVPLPPGRGDIYRLSE